MAISSVLNQGIHGMQRSQQGMARAAHEIVSAGTVDKDSSDTMDLIEPMVEMHREQHLFDASAKVVQVADRMLGTLINIRS